MSSGCLTSTAGAVNPGICGATRAPNCFFSHSDHHSTEEKKIPACHCATSGLTRLKKLSFKAVSHFKEVLIAYRGSQLLQEMFEVIAVVGEKRTIVIIVII